MFSITIHMTFRKLNEKQGVAVVMCRNGAVTIALNEGNMVFPESMV